MDDLTSWAIEEHGGDRYPDLAAVQRLSLNPLAVDLVATMRSLMAEGILRKENGKITVNQERGL